MPKLPLIISLLSSITLVGCSQTKEDVRESLLSTGDASAHAIDHPHIREQMNELDKLVLDRFYTDQELESMRIRYFSQVADSTANIILIAEDIRISGFKLGLDDKSEVIYNKLASRLKQQAAGFGDHAVNGRYSAARPALKGMLATCQECHALFRNAGED